MSSSEVPLYRHDITLSLDRNNSRFSTGLGVRRSAESLADSLKDYFDTFCNQYVFQLEDSRLDVDYDDDIESRSNFHFQCRINCTDRKRCSTIAKAIGNHFDNIFYRISVTATNSNPKTKFDYCMKTETRVAGPWSDRLLYLGEDLISDMDMYPWQKDIFNMSENDNEWFSKRKIFNVYDPEGGHGKSSVVKKLAYEEPNKVGFISNFATQNQLASAIVKSGIKNLYIIDLPRVGLSWTEKVGGKTVRKYSPRWYEMVELIETVKNGGPVFDTMHGKSDMLIMRCPVIVIFSNFPLENRKGELFSKDRLEILQLSDANVKDAIMPIINPKWHDGVPYVQLLEDLDNGYEI